MSHSVRYVLLQFLSVSAFFYYEKTSAIFSSVTCGMYIIGIKAKQEVLKNTVHLPPLRLYCVSWDDGWNQTQNYYDFIIGSQTL
jgi:hypothetical protein